MSRPRKRRRRQPAKGTRELRRRFPGLPPIRVASGTHRQGTVNRLNTMLRDLRDAGRLDYLRLIVDKTITPLALFDRVRGKDYADLPPPNVVPLREQVTAWQADRVGEVGDDQRANDRWAWKCLLRRAKKDATVDSVPDLIRAERKRRKKVGQFTAFNRIKAAALAFLRDRGFKRTKTYLDVLDIKVLPTAPKRVGLQLPPQEALAVAAALPEACRSVWWTMCTTGMDNGELWGAWELEDGHLRIHGKKRRGRVRLVPLVMPPSRPTAGLSDRMFAAALKTATAGRVQPRDGRRTYAKWLALAGVIKIHQDAYMGHGPKSMTELYQRGNEKAYLDADADRIRAWLGAELGVGDMDGTLTEMLPDGAPEAEPCEPVKLLAASTDAPRGS